MRIIDVPKIFEWENNPENWEVSETVRDYTFEEIILLIDSAEDIFENGQLRFIIVNRKNHQAIGTLDLFQVDFIEKSIHVGILIGSIENRRKGFAEEAIKLAMDYCFEILMFNKVYCHIQSNNVSSLKLFKKCGFELINEDKENPIFESNSERVFKMKLWLKK